MTYKGTAHHWLLLNALVNPASLVKYDTVKWELLLRLARKVKLLARLATDLKNRGLLDQIPPRAANLLQSSLVQAKRLQQITHWELNRISWALKDTDIPVLALKGVAYSLAGLPESAGRVYVDLDIMVPKHRLPDAETALTKKGWMNHHKLSAYDEHYYRVWSHEIPPLIHAERETEVDIHHSISAPTSRLKINTERLFEAAVAAGDSGYRVLCPIDMVLHCVVNLFENNELADDLRDLLDIHDLLLFFSRNEPDFWKKLKERANQLNLGRPLFYGVYFSRLIFKTPIPENLENDLNEKPNLLARWVMHQLVPQALFPLHPDKHSRQALLARSLLYLRSHWIRMPIHLLLPHLAYKTYLSIFPGKAATNQWKK
jgi:hypothetical protein